jgi:cytoskeletal protein CcmA (bactofilin family)
MKDAPQNACSPMLRHDTEVIRDAFSRKGLSGAELEAAMLAYKIAHNLSCKEDDMFGKKKDSQAEKDQTATLPKAARLPDAAKIAGQPIQQLAAVQQDAASTQPEATSSIGSSLTIIGKLVGDGSVTIYGHVEGELQAPNVVICEGAQVEGNIFATELGIGGRVKGTIHAVRVKLYSTAVVEGDIFHQSLAIEENARFEGASRREDNLADTSSSGFGTKTASLAALRS